MTASVHPLPVTTSPATPDVPLSEWLAIPSVRKVMKEAVAHRFNLPPFTPEQASYLTELAGPS